MKRARAGTAGCQIAVILSPNTTRRVPSLLRTQYIQTHERVVAVTRTPLYFSRFPNVTCLREDLLAFLLAVARLVQLARLVQPVIPIAEAGYYATERGDQTKETEQVQLVYTSPMVQLHGRHAN
jgi:hypothetical protein